MNLFSITLHYAENGATKRQPKQQRAEHQYEPFAFPFHARRLTDNLS